MFTLLLLYHAIVPVPRVDAVNVIPPTLILGLLTLKTRSSATAEIARIGGLGHSESSILVPIESPYATSY